jgi:signal transduction histidine kinase/ligand-binding sensor domain-containing protein
MMLLHAILKIQWNQLSRLKSIFILFILAQFGASHSTAQNGIGAPIIRNFTPKEYQAEVRNWSMVQDNRGVMFVGNNAGVLKFDGNTWRLIPVNNTIVRSLAIDPNNKIYVGAQGEFGYLKANEQGKLEFVSMIHLLDSAERNFTDVWTTHARNDTVYFHTVLNMFRVVGNQVKSWPLNYSYHRSFFVFNKLYVRQDDIGLTQLVNDEFKAIPGGEIFKKEFVTTMLPLPNGKILVGSRNNGLYLFDPKATDPTKTFIPFNSEVESFLKYHALYSGAVLSNGNLALGTITGGVLEITSEGKKINLFDESAGLQNNTAFYVFSEKHNNLVVLSNGISIVETHSPITVWGKGKGLRGTVLTSLWHDGILYAGTADGLFYLDNATDRFNKIEGVGVQCWQIKSYKTANENSLLAASTFGLYEIKNKKAEQIDNGRAFSILMHPNKPGLILTGQDGTLLALQKEKGKWIKNHIPIIKDNLFWSMAFDAENNLWLSTEIHGIIKIDRNAFDLPLNKSLDPKYITKFDTLKGLPSLTKTYIFNIHNKLCAATTSGVYFYNKTTDSFIVEEEIFRPLGTSRRVYQLAQDKFGNVWFESSRGKGVLKKINNTWQLEEIALKRLPALPEFLSVSSVIFPDDSIVWFGSAEGLIRFNATYPKKYDNLFSIMIRSVSINDSIRFWGNGANPLTNLAYDENKLLFSYSAAFYEGGEYNQFSYKLEGFDKGWSDWTRKTEKEYTNLSFGNYVFKVKARNIFGKESNVEMYAFTILAPWYLSWWMFPIYTLAAAVAVFGIVKWRVARLNNEKIKLERKVEEHTREIKSQNEELRLQKEEILSQRDHLEIKNQLLEDSRQIIAQQNQELETSVEKRTIELAEANHELSERYRQLEQFSFIAAHNLRAPVARILGLISILDKQNLTNPNNTEILDKLVSSSKDLDAVISDLGAIVNLQRGDSLEYETLNIRDAIELILKPYQEEISRFNIALSIETSIQTIVTIPVYFTSILSNLISNAVKYRSERNSPTIHIEISCFDSQYQLIVEDNGIGFDSEKFADKLFNPFQRFHTHNDGKGLGMYLIKTQVKAMNGSVRLKSKEREGTRVEIILPIPTQS